MALIDKGKIKSDFANWALRLENARTRVNSVVTTDPPHPEMGLKEAIEEIESVRSELNSSALDLTNNQTTLQILKTEVEYKAAIVGAWPRNLFADRLTYFGTALLGVGSGTFIILGAPLDQFLLAPLVLWIAGFLLLGTGLIGVAIRESHRWDYFKVEFEIPEKVRLRILRKRML